MSNRLLTINEVCRLLRINRQTFVKEYIKKSILPLVFLPGKKNPLVDLADIEALINKNKKIYEVRNETQRN